MCGIAGIRRGASPILPPLELCIRRCAIGARTTGAYGDRHHALYAHTRLSVIDPSPAGISRCDRRRPLHHRLQRRDLQFRRAAPVADRAGVAFRANATPRSCCDSTRRRVPFVERAARHVCLRHLGRAQRTLLLARDRFGIKPLYYHDAGGLLTFASEGPSLARLAHRPRRSNRRPRRILPLGLGARAAHAYQRSCAPAGTP